MQLSSLSLHPVQKFTLGFVLGCALAGRIAAAEVHSHVSAETSAQPASAIRNSAGTKPVTTQLPPLPAGVTELKFSDFFVKPVGPRGLELTDKLRETDGRRVRMLGYIVHQEDSLPGMFLFAPVPAQVHEHDNALADDLPPGTLRVHCPTYRERPVPFVPGLMLLTGTLRVGNRAEADGRISIAQLELDPPAPDGATARSSQKFSAPPGKGAERLVSRVRHPSQVHAAPNAR